VTCAHKDKWNTAWAMAILGLVLIYEENFTAAESTLEESKVLFQELNDKWGFAHAVICLALGPTNQDGRATTSALNEQALALNGQALTLFRELGDRYFEAVALRDIGLLKARQGDVKHAMVALHEALILAQQIENKFGIAGAIRRIGNAEQLAGNPARAIHLFWAARNVFDSIGAWSQNDAPIFENWIAPCRAALGESAFAEAVEQGQAMTMEQAIAYALGNEL
jgi:tetratricopeptide (TPR) repeat protein